MKKIFPFILFLFVFTSVRAYALGPLKTFLQGKVTDKASGQPVIGARIYIPDLKTGAVSDMDGTYRINNLPSIKVTLEVSFLGYKTIIETVDLSQTNTKDFALEESVKELNEVVITGSSSAVEKSKTAAPVTIITKDQLLKATSTNIIDALAKQPGIAQISTGAGISKPVIRGLGYNRVVVVNDGIRQEGQQWGDEHGIEIDEYSVDKVEVLKGPASLTYGSDAMAGVINIMSAPTLPEGKINGSLLSEYQSNNGLFGISGRVAGNRKGMIWDMRYSNKMAHDYRNRYDGYVFNSGFQENNLGLIFGFNKSWGYSHLHLSLYNMTPGIVEGERDSASGKFVRPAAVNDSESSAIVTPQELKSYKIFVPYQKIHHYKAVWNSDFIIGKSALKTVFGFQQNQRQEYADVLKPDIYGLYFLLNTFNYDVRYELPEKKKLNVSFGLNGMQQTSMNKGSEFLVPAYHLFDAGLFVMARKNFEKVMVSGGVRFDKRFETSEALYLDANEKKTGNSSADTVLKFSPFDDSFTGFSGSLGANWEISKKLYTKLNISRGFRAPNIGELGANGVHEGTFRYEMGNPNLSAEHSWQLDYGLGLNTGHITAELDLFTNQINNFIFLRKLNSASGNDSLRDGLPAFMFTAGNAALSGGEVTIDIHPHPLDWLHFGNTFSYVNAILKHQPDSMKYLPFTPPARFTSSLRASKKKLGKCFANAYGEIGLEYYFAQKHIYAAYNTETATPGYALLNLGLGADIMLKNKNRFSLFIAVNNLADAAYQSHLSRLKYEGYNYLTGRSGVYNMGRNISFKLIIPFDIKK